MGIPVPSLALVRGGQTGIRSPAPGSPAAHCSPLPLVTLSPRRKSGDHRVKLGHARHTRVFTLALVFLRLRSQGLSIRFLMGSLGR